jgi:hypothetical protein
MKIKIIDKFSYQAYPITEDMIEVDEDILKEIGKIKCFENGKVVDYDNSTEITKEETELKIIKLTNNLDSTDYIANKLAEAVSKFISTGDNTDVLLLREKYALELANREEWRKEIDLLEEKYKGE